MAVTNTPRQLKLFSPNNGGDVIWRDIGDPLELQNGIPVGGENLECRFKQPDGSTGVKTFYVTHDIFLEASGGGTPPNNHPISNIPDDQLLACVSMAAILAGEVHPGTQEFLTQIASDQNNKNFQTILGDCKIKTVTIVDTGNPVTDGSFYDLEFQRTGQGSNTKTVQSDIVNISKYANRANSYQLSACCAAGAVTEEFGKKTVADLGSEGSQLRNDIADYLKDQRFYA